MPYKQVKAFERSKGGNVPGSCLKNTRMGFEIPRNYDNAWEAWLKTQQHVGLPPAGLDVPVFFWYKDTKNGHIGVRLTNGQFWSDGNLYASITDYEAVKTPNYVGWGESINGVRVLQYVADPVIAMPKFPMPKVGARIHFRQGTTRTVFDANNNVLGSIQMKDNTYEYTVRGIKNNQILINSAQFAKKGHPQVYIALYMLTGARIDGWAQL